ncbi:MAG: energy transducer TonB [Myxococcota bacterium]
MLRWLGALGIGVLGTFGVVGLSLGMNAQVERVVTEPVATIAELDVSAKPKPPDAGRKQRSSPVKRASRAAAAPGPMLAAGLSGLDFGLGGAADLALADATAALVGEMGGAVVDERSVQDPPRATTRTPPTFPARARSLGQSGRVTLSFVVDVDGSVQDVTVVEAEPPGVFDDAAVAAVESWAFEPGRNEGMPVAVRVRQTLTFELE